MTNAEPDRLGRFLAWIDPYASRLNAWCGRHPRRWWRICFVATVVNCVGCMVLAALMWDDWRVLALLFLLLTTYWAIMVSVSWRTRPRNPQEPPTRGEEE